jgi:magnesium transporter
MIEIMKCTNGELKKLQKPTKDCWINMVSPTQTELKAIEKYVKIPKDIMHSVKDKDELSSIDEYDEEGIHFVLIRVPVRSSNTLDYSTVPLGILRTKKYIITLSYFHNDVVEQFKTKKIYTAKQREFGLKLLLTSTESYLNYLREVNKKIYTIRKDLQKSLKNKNLMKLLDIEKSLVYFNTSLKANKNLVERMKKEKLFKKVHEDLLEEVIEEYDQALEMTKIYTGILTGMMDGFSSVISNNMNATMKFLASITLILMLPTLISSIYGMNIGLPFQNDPNAFLLIILGSILLSVLAIVFFWKTDLL